MSKTISLLSALLCTFIWGTTFIAQDTGMDNIGPFTFNGNQRAHFLIKELINKAYREGANIPYTQNTPYINTIPPEAEVKSNGDQNIERRIRSFIRWNAAAMVVRANKKNFLN